MDASKKGLRACLYQKGKVICFASRALTKTEQNYQNLEREALGTIWGMEKSHYLKDSRKHTEQAGKSLSECVICIQTFCSTSQHAREKHDQCLRKVKKHLTNEETVENPLNVT